MSPKPALLAIAVTAAAAALSAQAQVRFAPEAPVPPASWITGHVVDGSTGRPLTDVLVILNVTPPSVEATQRQQRVMVDGDGQFFFGGLAAGTYTIAAMKPGYLRGAYGSARWERGPASPWAQIVVRAGESRPPLKIALWRPATISGAVTDERGEPVVGVTVRAFVRTNQIVGPRFASVASLATTDDRGAYRITGLTPGQYLVAVVSIAATFQPGGLAAALQATKDPQLRGEVTAVSSELSLVGSATNQQFGDLVLLTQSSMPIPPAFAPGRRMEVYPTTFYPGAAVATAADAIAVQSGDDRTNVNIQLKPVPTIRISGRLNMPESIAGPKAVRLVPASLSGMISESRLETATALSAADGTFTFLGVPAGQYLLRVTTPMPPAGGNAPAPPGAAPLMWAAEPLSVGDTDISDLSITLRPGIDVSGRVEFRADKPGQIEGYPMSIWPADGGPDRATAEFDSQGAGTFRARIVPGRYFFVADTPWFVVAVTYNGQDVSDTAVDVKGDAVSGITVILSRESTRLSGTVQRAQGTAAGETSVFVFPVNRDNWSGAGLTRRRLVRQITSDAGAFEIRNLPPGEYFIVAIEEQTPIDWPDPKTIEALSRLATRMTLTENEQRTMPLVLRQLR